MDLKNAKLAGTGKLWRIADPDPMAGNTPGQPVQVEIEEKPLTGITYKLSVPPFTINIYELTER